MGISTRCHNLKKALSNINSCVQKYAFLTSSIGDEVGLTKRNSVGLEVVGCKMKGKEHEWDFKLYERPQQHQ